MPTEKTGCCAIVKYLVLALSVVVGLSEVNECLPIIMCLLVVIVQQ